MLSTIISTHSSFITIELFRYGVTEGSSRSDDGVYQWDSLLCLALVGLGAVAGILVVLLCMRSDSERVSLVFTHIIRQIHSFTID